jgi:hypothetical protein
MTFTIEFWKMKLRDRLINWKSRMKRTGVSSVYAFISVATLWPIVESVRNNEWASLAAALGGVLSGLGSNLIANQIQKWKDEESGAKQLADEVIKNPDLQSQLDAVLEKLDALSLAREMLPPIDQDWFLRKLRTELEQMGNIHRFEVVLFGEGAIAHGPGSIALGQGAKMINFDVNVQDGATFIGDISKVNDFIGHDQVKYNTTYNQISYIINQYTNGITDL